MGSQARAVLWAQWRTIRNFYPRSGKGSLVFTSLMAAIWYGIWCIAAFGVAALLSMPSQALPLARIIPSGLLLVFLYWQVIPILMAAGGASLEIRRLMVYPIPPGQLFSLEVLLRVTSGLEMLIVLTGASIGLLLNPLAPKWASLALLPFIAFNLFLSAGVRDLLARLLARKRIRELTVFVFVLIAALPQLLVSTGATNRMPRFFARTPSLVWPWGAAGRIAAGEPSAAALAVLLAWTMAAWQFGRWQFNRSLRFDEQAAAATVLTPLARDSWIDRVYRLPSLFLRDPLGALVEKEVRFLTRAPRFRLVFFMGFSFGLIIWLPLAIGRTSSPDGFVSSNYLTIVTVYALLLLGDALFWNNLGFDRSAAQVYFLAPVEFAAVLKAKNLAAGIFVFLEIAAVAAVCSIFRMPVTPARLGEAFSVAAVMTLYLVSIGNLGSTHQPRPMSPQHSWRSSSARSFQALLLIVYPLICLPILLAFAARYAFESEAAFYGVLAIGAIIGAVIYSISMESSVDAAERRKEQIIAALSAGEGPVAS